MGARVVKIMRNAVVLKTADRELTLKTAERQLASLVPGAGGNRPMAGPSSSAGTMVLNKAEIDSSLKDMGTMLSTAQVRPNFSAGAADGFMITNIQQESIFHKIGLQNGDIVQGIDERPLRTAEDMVSFYNQMKTASPVSLKLKRQGKQEVFQYTFR
jgi:general secretion pathway protein C